MSSDPQPVVVSFKTKEELTPEPRNHPTFGEPQVLAAHSGTTCDRCGKSGLVPTTACEAAAGMHGPERELYCEECTCVDPDCDAPIVDSEKVVIGDPRSVDPRTEPVVECAEGHRIVP